MRFLTAIVLMTGFATAQNSPQPDFNKYMTAGMDAFRSARYPKAIDAFQRAVDLEPNNVTANMHLGSAWMARYIPGVDSPQNADYARNAELQFRRVLEIDGKVESALTSLGSLQYQSGMAQKDRQEKARLLRDARESYTRVTTINARAKEAFYTLGVIAWAEAYAETSAARARLGMKPEDPGPITDSATRVDLSNRFGRVIDEGMSNLRKALEIDPRYDDAMAYLNLLYRQRAALDDAPAQAAQDASAADEWVRKALEVKKSKGEQPKWFTQAEPSPLPNHQGGPQRIRVGANVQAANLITKVEPVYPPLAVQARIQGTVRFSIVIDAQGRVSNIQLISGHPLLIAAAQDALRQWVYKPVLLNGGPVDVVTQADINFVLP